MTTSAIQQDVQQEAGTNTEQGAKPRQRGVNPREEAMERLSQARNEAFTQETGIKIEALADPDADPDEAEAEATRQQLEANDGVLTPAQQLETQQAEPVQAPAAKRKVKIDGQEVEVSDDEIVREYQKGRTADKRLSDLAEERRRLDAERQELETQRQQLALQASNKVGNAPEVELDPAVTKEFTSALFSGDEEKATQAFNKALSSATKAALEKAGRSDATPPIDPVAFATQVRQQIAIDSVLEQSRKDYPQMYADPDIEAIAAMKIDRLKAEGKPFAEALTQVTSELATKFSWQAPGRPTAAPANNRREEKLARKEGIDNVGAGPNVKSTNAEPPPQSASDIIKEMQRARGQV